MLAIKNMQKYTALARTSFSTINAAQNLNYYSILGVSNLASSSEIMQAYSNLAKVHIPSVQATSEFLEEEVGSGFRKIAEAYAVLSHPESRNNYDLFQENQPERIYSEVKARQAKHQRERDSTGHTKRQPHAPGSFAEERSQVLAEERAKFNVNFLGRYKGGLPQRGKGPVRGSIHGSALGIPGQHHDVLVHNEKTNQHPDYQNVTNEMANDFSAYQGQSRDAIQRRWPAFQAKVDYDYFKFSHYQYGLKYMRNILLIFLGIPGLAYLTAKWRNQYALYQFKSQQEAAPGSKVQVFGRDVVVGKSGAVKFAN